MGLTLTSESSSYILSKYAMIFILLEKVIIYKSKFSMYKAVASILSVCGLIFIHSMDSTIDIHVEKDETFVGDFFILLGALFYSIYSLSLKYYAKKYKHYFNEMEVFGYIGLYNMILIPFALIFLNIFQVEEIELPKFTDVCSIFLYCLVNELISGLLQCYSITLLSPNIVTFGLTLTLPFLFSYNFFYSEILFNSYFLIGSCLLFIGFCLVFIENYLKYLKKKRKIEGSPYGIIKLNSDRGL